MTTTGQLEIEGIQFIPISNEHCSEVIEAIGTEGSPFNEPYTHPGEAAPVIRMSRMVPYEALNDSVDPENGLQALGESEFVVVAANGIFRASGSIPTDRTQRKNIFAELGIVNNVLVVKPPAQITSTRGVK